MYYLEAEDRIRKDWTNLWNPDENVKKSNIPYQKTKNERQIHTSSLAQFFSTKNNL